MFLLLCFEDFILNLFKFDIVKGLSASKSCDKLQAASCSFGTSSVWEYRDQTSSRATITSGHV